MSQKVDTGGRASLGPLKHNRLFSIIFLPALLMALFAPLQDKVPKPPVPVGATLQGRVVDAVSGEGLAGAIVEIPEIQRGGRCNKSGRFRINAIPLRAEAYEILVRAQGYKSHVTEIVLDTKANIEESFSLQPLGY